MEVAVHLSQRLYPKQSWLRSDERYDEAVISKHRLPTAFSATYCLSSIG